MPRFMFPPHPASGMMSPATALDSFEGKGWIAQRKFNGSHMIGHLHRGVLTLWNRQFQPFTYYTLTESMTACFNALGVDPEVEVIFDGELLHTKAKLKTTQQQAATHTIVVYDLLYFGSPLLHKTFLERYSVLAQICGNPTELEEPKKRGLKVQQIGESHLWLAELFRDDFSYRFYEMYEFDEKTKLDLYPEIEGLVLKRIEESYITIGSRPYDVRWMMRVRKEKPNMYTF